MRMGDAIVAAPPRTSIYGQPHFLAYINPEEADLLRQRGGGVGPGGRQIMGPAGLPAFADGPGGSGDGAGQGGGDPGSGGGVGDDGGAGNANDGGSLGPEGSPVGPTGPSAAELEKQRQEKLAQDRGAAKKSLTDAYGARLGDSLYDDREAAFRSAGYENQIDQQYQDALTRSFAGLDPELHGTPIAREIYNGYRTRRDEARAGITPFWESQELSLRTRADKARNEQLTKLQASENPTEDLAASMSQLDQLAAEYGGFSPVYQFSLGQTPMMGGIAAQPGAAEQMQAENLRRLLESLPPLNSATTVT